MTDRSRVAIAVVTTLALGAFTYGHAFAVSPPGVLRDAWESSWAIYGLAVLGVFLVYRWWALLPAIAPAAVIVYLHNMTDYVAPWREEPVGPSSFSDEPALYVVFVIGGILLEAAVLSVGLLLRATWEWIRFGDCESSPPIHPGESRDSQRNCAGQQNLALWSESRPGVRMSSASREQFQD